MTNLNFSNWGPSPDRRNSNWTGWTKVCKIQFFQPVYIATSQTSDLTLHTSHLTPHTSHLALHTSHLTTHTTPLTPHTSHHTPHTPLTPHTSHLTPNRAGPNKSSNALLASGALKLLLRMSAYLDQMPTREVAFVFCKYVLSSMSSLPCFCLVCRCCCFCDDREL